MTIPALPLPVLGVHLILQDNPTAHAILREDVSPSFLSILRIIDIDVVADDGSVPLEVLCLDVLDYDARWAFYVALVPALAETLDILAVCEEFGVPVYMEA